MQIATNMDNAIRQSGADDELAFAGVARLAELLAQLQATPRELAEFYLARIERIDPVLNAFISVRAERALAEADAALARLRAGERGPLLGIPIALKDNLDLEGEITTHGSPAALRPAPMDSEVVRVLRAAGAVILGKTALCELAAWGHFTSSAAHGVTRNPWRLDRSTGGSSGGSAAAVAAGLVPVALGSDGGGSIRIPSAFCGLFGLKPQRGRISIAPLTDHWSGCTVFGALGRTVLDVAIVDDVIRGPLDGIGDRPAEPDASFVAAARRDPGKLRIAVSVKPTIPGVKLSKEALTAIERTTELLRSLGHEVAEHELAHPKPLTAYTPRWAAGIREDARALAEGGARAGARDDGGASEQHPTLEPRSRRMTRVGARLSGRALSRSLERETALARRLNEIFERYDLVMTPTTAAPAPPAEISFGAGALRTFNQGSPCVCYTPTWNYVGQPAASVPAGFDRDGVPIGVQFAGPPSSDPLIVSLAAQLEAASRWPDNRPPDPTAGWAAAEPH